MGTVPYGTENASYNFLILILTHEDTVPPGRKQHYKKTSNHNTEIIVVKQ